jgi:hypothetical protein
VADHSRFVGIDVGKRYVDVSFEAENKVEQFPNDDKGIAEILRRLEGRQVERIVLEASGGYHRQLLASLLGAKYPAIAVNPGRCETSPRHLAGWRRRSSGRAGTAPLRRAGSAGGTTAVDPALEEYAGVGGASGSAGGDADF